MPETVPPLTPFHRHLLRGYRALKVEGRSLLLAVSGGADSTALALGTAALAKFIPVRFEIASLDHGLRPEGADEVRRVGELANRLAVRFSTRTLAVTAGPGLEARARAARYHALEELRVERGLDFVVTAHSANDQAETVLMRLSRGSATRGAAGILARRGRVIRPMLDIPRAEILAALRTAGEPFTEDPMNLDPSFFRVRIRRELLPALERAAGPQVVAALSRFAKLAASDASYLDELARDALARVRRRPSPEQLDLPALRTLPEPIVRRVIAAYLEELGHSVDAAVVASVLESFESGRSVALSGRAELHTSGGVLRVVTTAGPPEEPALPEVRLTSERPVAGVACASWPRTAQGTPRVRTRRPGDRVLLPDGRTKKLQDLLVDLKVPREQRDRLPLVVEEGGRVVWVVGVWPKPGERSESSQWIFVPAKQAPV